MVALGRPWTQLAWGIRQVPRAPVSTGLVLAALVSVSLVAGLPTPSPVLNLGSLAFVVVASTVLLSGARRQLASPSGEVESTFRDARRQSPGAILLVVAIGTCLTLVYGLVYLLWHTSDRLAYAVGPVVVLYVLLRTSLSVPALVVGNLNPVAALQSGWRASRTHTSATLLVLGFAIAGIGLAVGTGLLAPTRVRFVTVAVVAAPFVVASLFALARIWTECHVQSASGPS